MKVKKILSVLLIVSLLCGFACCFAAAESNRLIGKAYISFVDTGVRTESSVAYPTAIGTIYGQSEVDLYAGDTVATVTKRFVQDVKGATANIVDTAWGTKYLASIGNVITDSGVSLASFGEYDAGSLSGWMYRLNNQFLNDSIDAAAVDIGDEIAWMYSCQAGADIGGNWEETSAAITGLNFTVGTLSPIFSADTKQYTLNLPKNATSVKVEAELKDYYTATTYTLVHGDKSVDYKYYREIPVSAGDKIIISTKKVTDRYDANYNYIDTVTDTDSVTVTIAQERGSVTDYIRAFFQAIIDFIKRIFTGFSK